jgi:uncharacterized membrane protein (DUF4010 family)
MVEMQLIVRLLVALAIGTLVGLEREYARYKKGDKGFAGIRTFMLICLFGALSAYVGDIISVWVFIVSVVAVSVFIIISYYISAMKTKYRGTTTQVAAWITFFLGAMSYYGYLQLAVLLAVLLTIVLYFRAIIHQLVKKMKSKELVATLKFAVVALVVLPFLPNVNYGPHGIFNPFIVWLMVVFISGISFIGYVLMKWFGERGIELTGIFGGLISSTAVTVSFAERSKRMTVVTHLVIGVILANAVMFIRILIELVVLNRALFFQLLIPFVLLVIVSVALAWMLGRNIKKKKAEELELKSPFTLGPALKFGAFFALIIALVKFANAYFSSKGIYVVSFLSGFADVDAITVSLAQVANTTIPLDVARNGIAIATFTNVGIKGIIAYLFGRETFGKRVLLAFIVVIVVGIGLVFLLSM